MNQEKNKENLEGKKLLLEKTKVKQSPRIMHYKYKTRGVQKNATSIKAL